MYLIMEHYCGVFSDTTAIAATDTAEYGDMICEAMIQSKKSQGRDALFEYKCVEKDSYPYGKSMYLILERYCGMCDYTTAIAVTPIEGYGNVICEAMTQYKNKKSQGALFEYSCVEEEHSYRKPDEYE